MTKLNQPSFSKGELSPELFGRVDTRSYKTGLATARNTIIHTYGGVSARGGQHFVGPTKHHTYTARLIPFAFKTTDQYMLEFGNLYMRVIRDGGYVLNASTVITATTQASPVVVTATAHGIANGEEVYIDGITGMTELNRNRYVAANITANTLELTHQVDGTDIDGTGFSAYISGGAVASLFELVTPYSKDDIFRINYTQSADIMTLVHSDYTIRELTRTGHTAWTLTELDIGPDIAFPQTVTVTVNTGGAETDRYRVTAIDLDSGEESLPGTDNVASTAITGATNADPVVITAVAHGMILGDEVHINSIVGMTELNENRYFVATPTANTFELTDRDGFTIDGTAFGVYSSGGFTLPTFSEVTTSAVTKDNTITWTAITNTFRYAVYRRSNGVYGLIGESATLSFDDTNISPDTTDSPPEFRNPFTDEDNDNPRGVGYFEQRRVFGGSNNAPDTSEFSQTANQSNFNKSRPLRSDDAITATLPSLQVNEIRHYVGLNDLLVFTSGSEWIINSGSDGLFSADTIRQRPQSTWGTSYRRPLLMGTSVLFCVENETDVRSFGYAFDIDAYSGNNLNVLSKHLVQNNQIKDWCATRTPEPRVYMVGATGNVLTLAYDQEQEVVGWTRWDTKGDYEATASLRSGETCQEDSVYFVIERKVDGRVVRYVELWRQLIVEDVRDAAYLDCYASYNDPKTITGATNANPVVITATAHGFANGDEVDISDIEWTAQEDVNGNEYQPDQLNRRRFTIASVTANTFELLGADGTSFQAYAKGGDARRAITEISGLGFLESEPVTVVADGNLVQGLSVSNSQITLSRPASRVHVGIEYIADIELLNIESPVENSTIIGDLKSFSNVVLKFYKTRGGFIGPDRDHLDEIKWRTVDVDWGDPIPLLSDEIRQYLPSHWNSNGRIFIRQKDPFPMTLLSATPDIEVSDV